MIFGSKIYRVNPFIFVSLLAIILTGCGGGGTEDSPPPANNNTSSSSSPVAIASSSQATSNSTSQSSAPASKSSTQATGSEPTKTNLSSSSQSSYVRSSRASSTASLEFTEEDLVPDPFDQLDRPPSTPGNLKLQYVSHNSTLISWQASTDDIALSHYEIRRNDIVIATSLAIKQDFEDVALSPNAYYTYKVRAIDARGNGSNFSNAVIVKTLAAVANTSSSGATLSSKPSSSSSSDSSIVSSVSSSKAGSSPTSNSTSSSSLANSSAGTATGVALKWIQPTHRENGEYMAPADIGGYQIRHYSIEKKVWAIETITDPKANMIILTNTKIEDTFEIATFDTDGLYSRFISLNPQTIQ